MFKASHNGAFTLLAAGFALALPNLAIAVTDLTFFAVSDTHYGRVLGLPGDSLRTVTVDNLNALPGINYPASVGGGPIGVPRGVIMPGDLVDRPYATRWALFTADYGVNGGSRMKFPVYDGMGNHDFYNYGTNDTTDVISKAFILRNSQRSGIVNFDVQHLHYSWDWDQVHFVQLNLFAGTDLELAITPHWDPHQSLAFLKADLEKNVGTSGRPVLVIQHFDVDTNENYYHNSQKDAMVALLKQYNCIGILHGHTHVERIYKYQGLDIFSDGAAFKGDILIFRILDGKMFVVNRVGSAWGTLKLEKTISMGQGGAAIRDRSGAVGRKPASFSFGVAGIGRLYAANRRVLSVTISRWDGRAVRRMQADSEVNSASEAMTWDRRDDHGVTVPPGMYLVRIAGTEGIVSRKVLVP